MLITYGLLGLTTLSHLDVGTHSAVQPQDQLPLKTPPDSLSPLLSPVAILILYFALIGASRVGKCTPYARAMLKDALDFGFNGGTSPVGVLHTYIE